MIRELLADATAAGKRLDLFVGEGLTLSRAKVKALFDEERIRVDGRKARKGDRVAEGQKISIDLEEPGEALALEPAGTLVVLREDEALVFVDKPGGMPSHPLRPGEVGTVANALAARYPDCAAASEDPREGGLCHRLDIETSGVLLAARSRAAWEKVRHAFTARDVDKRYVALVSGPLADEGEIEVPLRHSRRGDRVEPAADGVDAREAISHFRVLSRRGAQSLVEVRILTGVLHQVRAHLAAIGAPIVGDPLYGGGEAPDLGRLFLHARSLELAHPVTGERVRVESPLPAELDRALVARGLASPAVDQPPVRGP